MQTKIPGQIPMVSIVIPVRNAENTLQEALDSVLEQTLQTYEIVVVDDGSTDATPVLLKGYQQREPRLCVLRTDGLGPAGARNRGTQECQGKYLFFMDGDDRIFPNALENMVAIAEKDQAQVAIFGFLRTDGKKAQKFTYPDTRILGKAALSDVLPSIYQSHLLNPVWNKLWDRQFVEAAGIRFQHVWYGEDRLFVFDCLRAAERVTVNHGTYYEYRIQQQGSLVNRYFPEKFFICCRIDEEIRRLLREGGEITQEADSILFQVYLKSILSCLSVICSPSAHFPFRDLYKEVKKILKSDQLRGQICSKRAENWIFRVIQGVLRSGWVCPSILMGWTLAFVEQKTPYLFSKAKNRIGR